MRNVCTIHRVAIGCGLMFSLGMITLADDDVNGVGKAVLSVRKFDVCMDSNGKYWFIDPNGSQFLSIGINNVLPEPFRPRPNTQYYNPIPNQFNDFDGWKQDVLNIFQQHGFNTLGAWSEGRLYDGPLYGTVCLYVAGYARDRCLEGLRPGFEDKVRQNTKMMLAKYPDLDNVMGVFLDNEMPWYGHAAWGDIPNHTLLEVALSLPDQDDAKKAAVGFLRKRYASAEAMSSAWGKPLSGWDELTFQYARGCVSPGANRDRVEFIALAAEAFYATAAGTVRQMLPGKLILGTRFAAYAPEPVIRACGRYCDVISFNDYRPAPAADAEMLTYYWIWGQKKPLMITEFAWRARENTSGNPNSGGAGAVVQTQAQRAENYRKYVEDLLAYPMVIGAHWFEFADQSPQGRFDGENSNYGVVDIHHRPYTELLAAMRAANARLESLHAQSRRQAPQSLPEPKAVVFRPGQRPDRPPAVNLLDAPIKGPELFHAADAAITIKLQSDALEIILDTGNEWGCGVFFFGPAAFKNPAGPEHTTDWDGYSAIELDAGIGDGTVFDLVLDEAGAAASNAASYDTSAGDDAESFSFPANQGKQGRFVYRYELKDLKARKDFGNQKGARKVDINAMKGAALVFHGAQGKHNIEIYSFKLVR